MIFAVPPLPGHWCPAGGSQKCLQAGDEGHGGAKIIQQPARQTAPQGALVGKGLKEASKSWK